MSEPTPTRPAPPPRQVASAGPRKRPYGRPRLTAHGPVPAVTARDDFTSGPPP